MIARNLYSEIYSYSNYNLITEYNIQKIIFANDFSEVIKFNNESIELTLSLFMDYGVLYQLIFSHPDQTDGFGRKLAVCF